MMLREALQVQAPSLALQRAAADEIARLDNVVLNYAAMLAIANSQVEEFKDYKFRYESCSK